MKVDQKIRVMLEMRPALDGFAGIPQETRLLFRGLCTMESVEVEGLLQTSLQFLVDGMPSLRETGETIPESARIHRYARAVIALDSKRANRKLEQLSLYLKRRRKSYSLVISTILSKRHRVKTSVLEARHFENFIWQRLFAKTLPPEDFQQVSGRNFRICSIPWNVLQSAGLYTLRFFAAPLYPTLDTATAHIFISQTPYPGRVSPGTSMVVRYHDALPLFMPHAFANKSRHLSTHYHALLSNVRSGAYFSCVSESTRQDLLRVFPELRERSVTIHNMVSHHYHEAGSDPARIPHIIRSRLNHQSPETRPVFKSSSEKEGFYGAHLSGKPLQYLLMVSTLEPRKNHALLISAWEKIRSARDTSLKLVIVGNLGWDFEPILREMRTWIDQGALFLLSNVPAEDLRVLYQHAVATVCPSSAEGFDYSGVECMRSGGIAVASDIPVHREVYGDGALYFNAHSSSSLTATLEDLIFSPRAGEIRERLHESGREVSSRYLPENILPRWEAFLQDVANRSDAGPVGYVPGAFASK